MLTKTQREVLERMADGWRLIHRAYEYCCLFPSGSGHTVTVRMPTFYALGKAGYIELASEKGLSRQYQITDAGRVAIQTGGKAER